MLFRSLLLVLFLIPYGSFAQPLFTSGASQDAPERGACEISKYSYVQESPRWKVECIGNLTLEECRQQRYKKTLAWPRSGTFYRHFHPGESCDGLEDNPTLPLRLTDEQRRTQVVVYTGSGNADGDDESGEECNIADAVERDDTRFLWSEIGGGLVKEEYRDGTKFSQPVCIGRVNVLVPTDGGLKYCPNKKTTAPVCCAARIVYEARRQVLKCPGAEECAREVPMPVDCANAIRDWLR